MCVCVWSRPPRFQRISQHLEDIFFRAFCLFPTPNLEVLRFVPHNHPWQASPLWNDKKP
jgi:hypothetical protein